MSNSQLKYSLSCKVMNN